MRLPSRSDEAGVIQFNIVTPCRCHVRMLFMDIYLRSIARRWKTEIVGLSAAKYVFSPYITSGTAESVLAAIAGEPCEIYTLFSAELFVSKASSLKTIKKLASYGHQIFHLPNLHAKIIFVPGAFASIGSQNLTLNGTRNKEASVLIRDKTRLLRIEKEIIPWLTERVKITPEMIADMEMLLQDITPVFRVFDQATTEADRAVLDNQQKRDAEALALANEAMQRQQEKLRLEAERKADEVRNRWLAEKVEQQRIVQEAASAREQRQRQLLYNMTTVQTSLVNAVGIVTTMRSGNIFTSDRHSLFAQDGRYFTEWSVDGKKVDLVRGNRYLITLQNGKLGWARVMNTRITFIEASISSPQEQFLAGYLLSITSRADWSESPLYGRNITFEVNDEIDGFASCTISAWFDLHDLTLLEIDKPYYASQDSKDHNEAIEQIRKGWPEIKAYCLDRILSPFVYVHNLTGMDASFFFGDAGTTVRLTAALINANPVLLGYHYHL